METIEMALAANGPYFCGLLVTACSIAEHARRDVALRFNVLDGGIADADWAFLEKRVRDYHPDSAFRRIPVDETAFADCPAWNGSRMTYVRLMLPKLLPDVDWVVYCDVDFTWMRDVAELWALREDRYAWVGVLDPAASVRESDEAWCAAHGFACPAAEYCCAGLSFLNLKTFRTEHLHERVLEMNRLHPPYNDQTIFNAVCAGRKKLVPEKWQTFHYNLDADAVARGCVVHHAGAIPWKPLGRWVHVLGDARMLWHRMHAKVYGISIWRSLRQFHSLGDILWHRGLFWLLRTPVLRQLIKAALAVARKPGAWNMFERGSRRYANVVPGATERDVASKDES